jgi:hypothetical protein
MWSNRRYTWEETRAAYIAQIDVTERADDPEPVSQRV